MRREPKGLSLVSACSGELFSSITRPGLVMLLVNNNVQAMKICILGAGKMGTWLTDALCLQHEVAIFDRDKERLRYVFNTQRLTTLEEIREFEPELLINSVTLKHTIAVFREVEPYLPAHCILSDIASVKTGFQDYYKSTGRRFVSTHPMFGPTFANLKDLSAHHAIIITESDHMGKAFFKDFFGSLGLNIHQYSFDEHDETIAYSLSIPFSSTLVFAACMKQQDARELLLKSTWTLPVACCRRTIIC